MAVQMPDWIHGVSTSEGFTCEGPTCGGENAEFWFSPKNQVSAQSDMPRNAIFCDHRAQIRDSYNDKSQRIVRELEREFEKAAFADWQDMFACLCRGDGPSKTPFLPDSEIVDSSTARISESGREIVEYSQTFRSLRIENASAKVILHVDPINNLPIDMITEAIDRNEKGEKIYTKWICKFDYPDNGPADIYALGVPISAQRLDGRPSPELRQVVEAARQARANFDTYEAVVSKNGMSSFFHIWRKGARFRAEITILNPPNYSPPDLPASLSTNLDWCRKHFSKYRHGPVTICDGKIVYETKQRGSYNAEGEREYDWVERRRVKRLSDGISVAGEGTARGNFVELYAYPITLHYPVERALKVEIRPLRPEDPPGMILIENKIPIPKEKDYAERFLVDPARCFVTIRHEINFDEHNSEVLLMENFEKSPMGIWYPTKVRRKHYSSPDLKELESTQTYYFFLEFPQDLPDEIFKPVSLEEIPKTLSE